MKHTYLAFLGLLVSIISCDAPSDPPRRPNILIAISDDQSFLHTSFAGSQFVRTPAFDRVAAGGVYFTNCTAGSPGCAPSRSALITGRHHWQNEQSGQHAAGWFKKYVPVVDVLHDHGYHVGMTGKGVGPFRYAQDESDSLLRTGNAAGPSFNTHGYDESNDPRPANGIRATDYARNFEEFISQREEGAPFYFWFGASEPHRRFEFQSGSRLGKNIDDVTVPEFLPDVDTVREDLLDYAVEIEWFDSHLARMLDVLDSLGELDNTIVIVTSDNGMAFPRAKANAYEFGIHVPLTVSYPAAFPQGRKVDDPVGFIDIAPTLLDLADIREHNMLPITGSSLLPILTDDQSGRVDESRKYTFSGRERHSSSRWNNLGYPQRAIRSDRHLLIWNLKPERAPAGVAVMLDPESREPNPMHGLQEGRYLPGTAYHDIDDCPTKTFMIENLANDAHSDYFQWAVGYRPEFEFYDIVEDPFCLKNLINDPDYNDIIHEMSDALMTELSETGDPRVVGPSREIFDTYPRYSRMRYFPSPEWAQ